MLKNRQLLFWLLVAVVVSRLLTMFSVPLADMTEPRYAEIARVMAATGDWITPWFHLNVPFWGKPPLSFWCQALSFKLFGVSEFTGRLPSWLATVGMLALVMRLASTLADRRVGLWAGLIFSTMALTYISAGTVMTDSFLALGTTLSLVSFAMVLSGHKRGWRWGPFIGLIIGLLAKGPLTLILLGTPVFFWALWSRGWKTLFTELPWGRGLLLTVVITLPWYIAAELKTPGFLDYFIVGEHIKRFLDPGWAGDLYGSAHSQPHGMIWLHFIGATFPWSLVGLAGLVIAWRHGALSGRLRSGLADVRIRLAVTSTLTAPVFFTLSGNILWTYVLPSLPFFAVLVAVGLSALGDAESPARGRAGLAAILLVPVIATVGGLYVSFDNLTLRTEKPIVATYNQRATVMTPALTYVGEPPFSALFYSAGKVRSVDLGELPRNDDGTAKCLPFMAVNKSDLKAFKALCPDAHAISHSKHYTLFQTPVVRTAPAKAPAPIDYTAAS